MFFGCTAYQLPCPWRNALTHSHAMRARSSVGVWRQSAVCTRARYMCVSVCVSVCGTFLRDRKCARSLSRLQERVRGVSPQRRKQINPSDTNAAVFQCSTPEMCQFCVQFICDMSVCVCWCVGWVYSSSLLKTNNRYDMQFMCRRLGRGGLGLGPGQNRPSFECD